MLCGIALHTGAAHPDAVIITVAVEQVKDLRVLGGLFRFHADSHVSFGNDHIDSDSDNECLREELNLTEGHADHPF